jgi:hypothetical protein
MARSSEWIAKCAQEGLDTADIVREAISQHQFKNVKPVFYWMILSARFSTSAGTVTPIARAVFRLTISS